MEQVAHPALQLERDGRPLKVFIKTYGCSLNQSDSETMEGVLDNQGAQIVSDPSEADVIVYNTCTVKSPSESKFMDELKAANKPAVIAGCITEAEKDVESHPLYGEHTILGVKQLDQVPVAIQQALDGHKGKLTTSQAESTDQSNRLQLPIKRRNPVIQIVPINAGCKSNCSYCKTKQARGDLESYRPMDIEKQVSQAVKDGVKEIWLTSQDTGAYGLDIGTNLAELLERLTKIAGEFRIRVGMLNPMYLLKLLDPLLEVMKHPKVFKFLHIPIQSGSTKVLRDMRRGSTTRQLDRFFTTINEKIPEITLATDIICGFPTETEVDFQETVEFLKKHKPHVVNISKFYPRPDTDAASMKLIPTHIVKDRTTRLTVAYREYLSDPSDWVRKRCSVIVDEEGKAGTNTMKGRNEAYRTVVIPNLDAEGNPIKLGMILDVNIVGQEEVYLKGELIDDKS